MKVVELCRYKRKRAAERQLVHHFMIKQVHCILHLLSRHNNYSMTPQQKEINDIFQHFLKRKEYLMCFFILTSVQDFFKVIFQVDFCHTYV